MKSKQNKKKTKAIVWKQIFVAGSFDVLQYANFLELQKDNQKKQKLEYIYQQNFEKIRVECHKIH